MGSGETWTVWEGPTRLGSIANFPWLSGAWQAEPAFERVGALFAEELRRCEDEDDWPAWEASYERIRERVQLRDPSGVAVPEFLLHIDAEAGLAWFRWSDEPFEPE